MKLFIITRCSRLDNLELLANNIFGTKPNNIDVEWHIIFDTTVLKDISFDTLKYLHNYTAILHYNDSQSNDYNYPFINKVIEAFGDGWVYHLDDDNLLHEDFYQTIYDKINDIKYSNILVYVFNQKVDKKDFTGLDIRVARPENMKVGSVDLAQWLVHTKIHNEMGFGYEAGYKADGHFIEKLHKDNKKSFKSFFHFIDKVLCYYNFLQSNSKPRVPKILYIGEDRPELKSYKWLGYEDDTLDTKYIQDDTSIISDLVEFKPDAIISRSDIGWQHHPNLASMPLQIRRKWIDLKNDYDGDIGELAYNLSMNTMLTETSLSDEDLISFFTPIYNTGDKLWKTYESLRIQTYPNWEWVLMNDSSDGGKTLKIAERIAKLDPRVRVYDFREKSGGIIGEVKWRACCMSRGYLLAELDHDDLLTPGCAMDLYLASKKHPECGFISNESCEVFEDWTSPKYPDGFAFGYGSYREEYYNGKLLNVVVQNGANPKTMRHIVGVPNHVRAWRRDTYFAIGGHNRYLSVADDYELIVRTFLHTRMCVIPKLGYIQFIYNNSTGRNTHDLSRADIQRRVRSISSFYNEKIRDRFEELGVEDWAYKENPTNPLLVASKFGEEEGNVSIFYTESYRFFTYNLERF